MNKYSIYVLAFFLITGCALAVPKGKYFYEEPAPANNSEMGTVYIYRIGNIEHGIVNIHINDEKVFGVVNMGYTWLYLKPGKYNFKAGWTAATKPLFEKGLFDEQSIEIIVEKAKVYYVNYEALDVSAPSNYSEAGLIGKMLEPKRKGVFIELKKESGKIGKRNLTYCRFQKNRLNNME